jgi:ribosomal protein S5
VEFLGICCERQETVIGFIAGRATRYVLEACGVDKKTAKWVGRGVGIGTSLATMDASGFFDLPDIPDGNVPDDSDDGS